MSPDKIMRSQCTCPYPQCPCTGSPAHSCSPQHGSGPRCGPGWSSLHWTTRTGTSKKMLLSSLGSDYLQLNYSRSWPRAMAKINCCENLFFWIFLRTTLLFEYLCPNEMIALSLRSFELDSEDLSLVDLTLSTYLTSRIGDNPQTGGDSSITTWTTDNSCSVEDTFGYDKICCWSTSM